MEGGDEDNIDALPSVRDLESRFGFFTQPEGGDGPTSVHHELVPTAAGCVTCECVRCKTWAAFIETGGPGGTRQYEVLTREHVRGLAQLILHVRAHLVAAGGLGQGQPLRVLELGAGNGRLAHALRVAMASDHPSMKDAAQQDVSTDPPVLLVASDLHPRQGCFPVLEMDYARALEVCAPDVALVSWMPLGHDWTHAVRASASVQALVLVGEAGAGVCGHPSLTWGVTPRNNNGALPRHERRRVRGWSLQELVALSDVQLCMLDEPWCFQRHSRTFIATRDERLAHELAAYCSNDHCTSTLDQFHRTSHSSQQASAVVPCTSA
mmetsp:Transcript_19145/g.51541  ORF Transcript_19145/g.51541 Transcript_19145/m.51541 type:complete len:323 (+) Transcript_19145:29-997(+)|eukprot:CAMPEP_0185184576 /NCGR_PEP_ID=MMETSP1140-20130426/2659_1 /TAXON_ID=298111 /ORGANISM="Pavlova sp., Strain CCMP459" /LENGTH=322 /DNA_ID=CAMNT_0027750655 /DNA_START=29 /DNA_END=997 /DNA_ORIENTATION=+